MSDMNPPVITSWVFFGTSCSWIVHRALFLQHNIILTVTAHIRGEWASLPTNSCLSLPPRDNRKAKNIKLRAVSASLSLESVRPGCLLKSIKSLDWELRMCGGSRNAICLRGILWRLAGVLPVRNTWCDADSAHTCVKTAGIQHNWDET